MQPFDDIHVVCGRFCDEHWPAANNASRTCSRVEQRGVHAQEAIRYDPLRQLFPFMFGSGVQPPTWPAVLEPELAPQVRDQTKGQQRKLICRTWRGHDLRVTRVEG
jgi:hypothetical protein